MADWSEDEYIQYLHDERRRYAWVMQRYGSLDEAGAAAAAVRRYPFETPETPYRGLVFHDGAWHCAMRDIHGDQFWISHPHLARPSAEYEALD